MNITIKSLGATALMVSVAALMFSASGQVQAGNDDKYEAQFNKDGELIRPAGWREWVFVGSPLTPNSLNSGAASFPGSIAPGAMTDPNSSRPLLTMSSTDAISAVRIGL